MSQPRRFLESLFAGKPNDLYILLWTLPEKESQWFPRVADAVSCAESITAHDLYVGVGLAGQDYGPSRRCKSEEIAGIVGLWADLDLRSEAHPKATLPASVEQALSILPPEFPPSIVVHTGNGVHVWWLFREPWIFSTEDDRRLAATLVGQWHTLLRDNASQQGWTYERLADLARVLRIPGTTNSKDPANPKPVVLHSQTDFRYNPTEIAEYLEDLGVPDDEKEASAAQEWAERFKDKPITINLVARIPDDILKGWMETDPRFKNTWFRQRPDLNDQSQSGYDLALACFGFRAGLEQQQIVDLLIHHRVVHKQKHRTRIDYFQRTLAKAAQVAERTQRAFLGDPPPAGSASAPEGAIDSERPSRSKASICRWIFEVLGIEVLRIVKISGKQPLYRMETAEGKMEFDNVGKLISQQAVRTAIAATVGKLIPPFKPKMWREIAQLMLDACILEDGGEELESEGAARLYIHQYLAETAFIPGISGQLAQDLRKPMILDDQIAMCSSELRLHLNKSQSQPISPAAVVGMLSAVGAKVERVRGKTFKEQSRWILPLAEFDPSDYVSGDPGGSLGNG